MQLKTLDRTKTDTFRMEPVWKIWVELGPEDDDLLRQTLCQEITLEYGSYDHVSFETNVGTQFFRGSLDTACGPMEVATSRPVRVLTFSIAREERKLNQVLNLIQDLHSYEEPVVYVHEVFATRALVRDEVGLNKWWNKAL